jgi:branched-chain amino acid transport system substrate-binding protein
LDETGAKISGIVRHPLGTSDFSSYLIQAQASGAGVIALLNGGADAVSAVKQAAEFGVTQSGSQELAALVMLLQDVKALGLNKVRGGASQNLFTGISMIGRANGPPTTPLKWMAECPQ